MSNQIISICRALPPPEVHPDGSPHTLTPDQLRRVKSMVRNQCCNCGRRVFIQRTAIFLHQCSALVSPPQAALRARKRPNSPLQGEGTAPRSGAVRGSARQDKHIVCPDAPAAPQSGMVEGAIGQKNAELRHRRKQNASEEMLCSLRGGFLFCSIFLQSAVFYENGNAQPTVPEGSENHPCTTERLVFRIFAIRLLS